MSSQTLNIFFVLILLLNFFVLASGRLRAVIAAIVAQGVLLGVVFPVAHVGVSAPLSPSPEGIRFWTEARVIVLAAVMVAMKGVVIPYFLIRAIEKANIAPKVETSISTSASLLIGAVGTGAAMAFAGTMPLSSEHANNLLLPTSLATVFTGMVLLTTRRQALVQVLGYIVLENGIFIFGLLLVDALPAMVEIGVLLDLFVGVFVMGIIIHHVSRAFPTASTAYLSALKE